MDKKQFIILLIVIVFGILLFSRSFENPFRSCYRTCINTTATKAEYNHSMVCIAVCNGIE